MTPSGVQETQTAAVIVFSKRRPPPLILKIPFDRLFNSGFKGFLRFPTKLGFQLGSVNGITRVVPGAVGDVRYKALVGTLSRTMPVHKGTNMRHDIDIATLVASTDIVGLAELAALDDNIECAGV